MGMLLSGGIIHGVNSWFNLSICSFCDHLINLAGPIRSVLHPEIPLQGLSILGLILIIARLMEASREIEFLKIVEVDWLGQFEDLTQGDRSILKHDIHIFIGEFERVSTCQRISTRFFHERQPIEPSPPMIHPESIQTRRWQKGRPTACPFLNSRTKS